MIKQKICNAYNWIKQKTIKFKKWFIAFIFGTAVLASGYGLEKIDLGVGKDPEIAKQVIEQKFLANENIKERYDFDNGKLITKIEHIDDIKIAVGEVDFKPNMEISRWNGEIKMKVKPRLNSKSKKKELVLEDKKIKYKEDKKEYHLYEVKKGDETYNGATSTMDAYEVEVILLEKPDSNIVEMDIETQGLNFYYQPELTQKEKDDGAFRPENVIGSYAVYHESKAGDYSKMGLKNYRAGKAFHIYRPKIIDNAGKEVWGKLNITDKLLTVEIPQEFLDNAVYPMIVDPTFGYTGDGSASWLYGNANSAFFVEGTPVDGSGAVQTITFYGYKASGSPYVKGAIWLKSDLSLVADSVTTAKSVTGSSGNWLTTVAYSSKPSVINNTNYLVGYIVKNSNDAVFGYDSGSSGDGGYDTNNSYTTPTNLSDPITSYTRKFWVYATYTAGGGAARRIIITQ